MKKLFLIYVFIQLLLICQNANALILLPADDGFIRDGFEAPKDGNPDNVILGSIVQAIDVPQFEDRGIIEYDITTLMQPITTSFLELNVFYSMNPYPFQIDIFTYSGDGMVTLSDFNGGTLFSSLSYSGEPQSVIDVTSIVSDMVTSGDDYIGFNLQFANPSSNSVNGPFVAYGSLERPLDRPQPARLFINELPPPEPSNVIPEPSTILLFSTGILGAYLRKRRSV